MMRRTVLNMRLKKTLWIPPTQLLQVLGVALLCHLVHCILPHQKGTDLENNAHLQMALIKAQVEASLEEVDKDLELADLPPLENVIPILIQASTIPGFVPFAISTSQCCVPSKGLPHRAFHPSLGTRTHIPSGYMVSTLWGQTTLDHNVSSD